MSGPGSRTWPCAVLVLALAAQPVEARTGQVNPLSVEIQQTRRTATQDDFARDAAAAAALDRTELVSAKDVTGAWGECAKSMASLALPARVGFALLLVSASGREFFETYASQTASAATEGGTRVSASVKGQKLLAGVGRLGTAVDVVLGVPACLRAITYEAKYHEQQRRAGRDLVGPLSPTGARSPLRSLPTSLVPIVPLPAPTTVPPVDWCPPR